jgi:spermidine synthase
VNDSFFTEWHTASHDAGLTFQVRREILEYRTEFQKLTLFENGFFGKVLLLDDLVMVTERDEFYYHEMLCHVPLSLHPAPKRVLIIGGGDGGSMREVLRYPQLKAATLCEIDRDVVEVCRKHLPALASSFADPRVTLRFADGVKFVKEYSGAKWDAILIDSSEPIGPAKVLISTAFYRAVAEALGDKGVLAVQAGNSFYPQQIKTIRDNFRILKKVFAHTRVYLSATPTYPVGQWGFIFASQSIDPVKDYLANDLGKKWSRKKIPTRYYNPEIHVASFALPEFLKAALR